MHVSKIIFSFSVLILYLTVCYSCDILDYSAICKEDRISVAVSFEKSFGGTIFANGYIGNKNCSSPNMGALGSTLVELDLPFLKCNTRITRVEGGDYLQAMNTITIQFHHLIKTVLDCEITVTCDIISPLTQDIYRSYLNRDLQLPEPIDTQLDIFSGEKLFNPIISSILETDGKYYVVLNVTDGGKNKELQLKKCYAHAKYVIDDVTDPDSIADRNRCAKVGLISRWKIGSDKPYADLRDFAEVHNLDLSFTQKSFYITCAFNRCLDQCEVSCFGETQLKTDRWSDVATHKVGSFDESFRGFNRNIDLRTAIKNLSDRLRKLKDHQIARQNTLNLKLTPKFDVPEVGANLGVFQEETFTVDDISTIYTSNISEDLSVANVNQDSSRNFSEIFFDDDLNNSDKRVSDRIGRRSIAEEIDYSINEDSIFVDSQESKVTDISDKFKNVIADTDCSNSSCRTKKDARSLLALENSFTINLSSNDSSLEFDEALNSTFDYLTGADGIILVAGNSIEKDCVPFVKFSSVTISLSILSLSLLIICVAVILLSRKERKRYNSHSKYLYNDF